MFFLDHGRVSKLSACLAPTPIWQAEMNVLVWLSTLYIRVGCKYDLQKHKTLPHVLFVVSWLQKHVEEPSIHLGYVVYSYCLMSSSNLKSSSAN